MKIPVESIHIPNWRTPRDYGDIRAFCRSIQEFGQLQPICVEPVDGKFNLIFGGRRLEAFKILGLHEIEAVTKEGLQPQQRKELELEENLQRKDFSPMEKVKAIKALYHMKKDAYENHGELLGLRYYSQEKFANDMNINQSEVSRALKLADASEKFPELEEAKSMSEAEKILRKILLEQKTGIHCDMKLEKPSDITTFLLEFPPARLIYAIIPKEDHWMIPEMESRLDPWGTLIIETDSMGEHMIFTQKPTIVQETGREHYNELWVLSKNKDNPLGERVINVERSYDFSLKHSHSRVFWEKVLKNTMVDANNKNLLIINPHDLSMGDFCFTNGHNVRYIYTDAILFQQMTAAKQRGK